jgi:tetratricopeptide (TPR) repeat protein
MRRALLVSVLLVLVTFAAYWQVRHADFLNFDDTQYVTNNPKVFLGLSRDGIRWAFTTFHAANWHPLTWISHMLDCQVFSDNPAGHHLVNVAFHATNAVLLFLLFWWMTGALARSAFLAALFALHPLHVESVAWISERKDVLSTFFGLLAMLAYLRFARSPSHTSSSTLSSTHSLTFYSLSLLLFALSLMSKPMLVTFPFLLLLLDYWPLDRMWRVAGRPSGTARSQSPGLVVPWSHNPMVPFSCLLLEKIPFLFLSLISSLITFQAQKSGGAVVKTEFVSVAARTLNACLSYCWYLAKTFWPSGLGAYYPYSSELFLWPAVAAGIALLVVTLAVLWRARRAPFFVTGWFWFLGSLVPVIGFVQVGYQARADRYTYVPLIGIFLVVTWGVADLLHRLFATERGCPNRSHAKSSRWRPTKSHAVLQPAVTGTTALPAVIENTPLHPAIRYPQAICATAGLCILAGCLMATFFQAQYWRNSITLFRRALLVSPENNALAHHNLGHALSLAGNQSAAIEHFQAAIRVRPDFAVAHFNWGNSLAVEGKLDDAMFHYQEALRYKPDYEEVYFNLGNAFALAGKAEEAEANFRQALRCKPDYAEAYVRLANLLDLEGKTNQARSNWLAAIVAWPDCDEAHYYLAGSLAREKKFAEAVTHLRAAVKANSRHPAALNDLAWILATQADSLLRDVPESIRLAERACTLTSRSNAMYLDTLAVALSESSRTTEAAHTAAEALAAASASEAAALSLELQKHLRLFQAGKPYHSLTNL